MAMDATTRLGPGGRRIVHQHPVGRARSRRRVDADFTSGETEVVSARTVTLTGWIFMVGLRVFDIGALIVWLVWFFKLRDDEDDEGGGGPGGGGGRGPDGGPPLPDAGPWPRRRRDHLGDLSPALLTKSTRFARFGGWPGSPQTPPSTPRRRTQPAPPPRRSPTSSRSTRARTATAHRTRSTVLDLEAGSPTYGQLVGRLDMPNVGDELHHFGWNACSSALCPWAPHPHVERRYLLVPGPALVAHPRRRRQGRPARTRRSSRSIEAEEIAPQDRLLAARTRSTAAPTASTSPRSAPPTATARAASSCSTTTTSRSRAPGRTTAAPQELAYDFWWHLGHDTRDHQRVGHAEHGRERRRRRSCCSATSTATSCTSGTSRRASTCRSSTSAPSTRWCSSCGRRTTRARPTASSAWSSRPPTCPPRSGCGSATATARSTAEKVITIPAEPAEAEQLPPALQPFGAVPPLITDIALSVDDQLLYVSCWGTGELKRYDVSDPCNPRETGSVRLGGIVERAAHPAARPAQRRPADGRGQPRRPARLPDELALRARGTRSSTPTGIDGWVVKLDAGEDGSLTLDPDLFVEFGGERPHQVRLEGGDASSDSYCFPNELTWTLWPLRSCSRCWAPTTGSTPRWAGCSRSRSGCRSATARAVLRALPPIAIGHEAVDRAWSPCSCSGWG